MAKAKRSKQYYMPGIISLIILPLLFIYYADKEISKRTVEVIPIAVADSNILFRYPEVFKPFKEIFPPKRNYVDILFNGNVKSDQIKLNFAQIIIKEILAANDSCKGLHFRFGDSSKYGMFVKTIDILRVEGAQTYVAMENEVWFYYLPPDTEIEDWICGTNYCSVIKIKDSSFWKRLNMQVNHYWKSSWELIIAFSIFILAIPLFYANRYIYLQIAK